jgi:hypothetical protein
MTNRFESKLSKIIRLTILTAALGTGVGPTGAMAMGLSGGLTPNLQFPPKGSFVNTATANCFLFFCTPNGEVTPDQSPKTSQQSGGDK